MTHLHQNHAEYWKTLRRTNVFGEPYTIGFSWFATFPTSKRLRWPFGKAEKVLPWVCTRKELMREGEPAKVDLGMFDEAHLLWDSMIDNPRQCWDRYGMEIKGEMR